MPSESHTRRHRKHYQQQPRGTAAGSWKKKRKRSAAEPSNHPPQQSTEGVQLEEFMLAAKAKLLVVSQPAEAAAAYGELIRSLEGGVVGVDCEGQVYG